MLFRAMAAGAAVALCLLGVLVAPGGAARADAAPPVVTGVSPDNGPDAGGTPVVVSGSGFTGATEVDFGYYSVPFTVVSDGEITVTSPTETGSGEIRVITPAGESDSTDADQFTWNDPTVTGISPNSGPPAGGTTVTITGTQFYGVSQVTFGSNPAASYVVNSPTSITAVAPPGALGSVHVQVDVQITSYASAGSLYGPASLYTYATPCTTTITGTHSTALTVSSGKACLTNAKQAGSVTVTGGASLVVTNSTVNGSVTATNPGLVTYCGSTENGKLSVSGATGAVTLGDGGPCAADTIPSSVTISGSTAPVTVIGLQEKGTLTLSGNTDGVTLSNSSVNGAVSVSNNSPDGPYIGGNTVNGSLSCTGNSGVTDGTGGWHPTTTYINTVSGTASGQCASIAQR